MSYITQVGTIVKQEVLQTKNDQLIADIRKIVGGKKFTFSDAYLKKHQPKIGIGERPINGITKKYVYVSCFLQHSNNEDNTEYGAIIKKFPICYQRGCGSFVEKVELEDLFIVDLDKILRELKFYLWWEANVRMPNVRAEYEKLQELYSKYAKLEDVLEVNERCKEIYSE